MRKYIFRFCSLLGVDTWSEPSESDEEPVEVDSLQTKNNESVKIGKGAKKEALFSKILLLGGTDPLVKNRRPE